MNFKKVENLVKNELKVDNDKDLEANKGDKIINSYLYYLIIDKFASLKNESIGIDKFNRPIKTPFAKTVEEISRDLGRTFHEGRFNNPETIESLDRILTAISFIRPEVGYCQGMNFVAGALLEFLNDEVSAFWVFLYLLDEFELNSLYFENMPDYSIRIFQLEHYLKQYLNSLYMHFKKHQINPDLMLSKWILTIFSSYLPFKTLSKVFDIFIIEGWKAIISFCLVFLSQLNGIFLNMDLQKISKYMRDNSRKLHNEINTILELYCSFNVTNQELQELREEFFRDQVVRKIENNDSEWDTDQLEALEIYKKSIDEVQKTSRNQLNKYKEKFENYNMLYKAAKEAYKKVRNKANELKAQLEELIESKSAFDKVLCFLVSDSNQKKDKEKIIKKQKECMKKIDDMNKEMLKTVSFY